MLEILARLERATAHIQVLCVADKNTLVAAPAAATAAAAAYFDSASMTDAEHSSGILFSGTAPSTAVQSTTDFVVPRSYLSGSWPDQPCF